MKGIRHFVYCENCNKRYEVNIQGKLHADSMTTGMIEIEEKSNLLEELDSYPYKIEHDFDGIYCNIDCLRKKIDKILKGIK